MLSDPELVGTFISEQEVAQETGVSRTPVREALLLLSAERLVQLVPNRGAFVPEISGDVIHAILQARAVLEVWAADEAIRNMTVPLGEMEACLARQRSMPADAPAPEFIGADRDFHAALIAACGNPVITQMYEDIRARHVVIGVRAIQREWMTRTKVIDEHQAIVDGLATGDTHLAQEAIRRHLLRTASRHARS